MKAVKRGRNAVISKYLEINSLRHSCSPFLTHVIRNKCAIIIYLRNYCFLVCKNVMI